MEDVDAGVLDAEDKPEGEEWITLITCGGNLVRDADGFGSYTHRDVVVARRIS